MWYKSLFGFFAPNVCAACGNSLVEGEDIICSVCRASIEPLRSHRRGYDNELRQRVMPRTAPISQVVACTAYTKQNVAGRLIRLGKFDDRPDIIRYLAAMFSNDLLADGVLSDIDALQPIPMRLLRRLNRGFNQAEEIAQVWSRAWGVPIVSALKATRRHGAQARTSSVAERATNVLGSFRLSQPDLVTGRHIAVVDDILTTGATTSAAIAALLPAEPRAISVITLAATVLRK